MFLMSHQGRSTKDKIETVDWILTLNEILRMDWMKYLKIEPGMNEIRKNRLNEILKFSQNLTFHPVHTYLLRMRGYQFALRSRLLAAAMGQKVPLIRSKQVDYKVWVLDKAIRFERGSREETSPSVLLFKRIALSVLKTYINFCNPKRGTFAGLTLLRDWGVLFANIFSLGLRECDSPTESLGMETLALDVLVG